MASIIAAFSAAQRLAELSIELASRIHALVSLRASDHPQLHLACAADVEHFWGLYSQAWNDYHELTSQLVPELREMAAAIARGSNHPESVEDILRGRAL
ncbi:hypothetical protein H2203_001527 [Taxawa tesnikishii (nom. ined.)]|nr:hypothetical protein H2203_001527 [Dothideales sp. JES 119]